METSVYWQQTTNSSTLHVYDTTNFVGISPLRYELCSDKLVWIPNKRLAAFTFWESLKRCYAFVHTRTFCVHCGDVLNCDWWEESRFWWVGGDISSTLENSSCLLITYVLVKTTHRFHFLLGRTRVRAVKTKRLLTTCHKFLYISLLWHNSFLRVFLIVFTVKMRIAFTVTHPNSQ